MTKKPFNINQVRNDFPILREQIHGKPLVYLDNAATTQKPQAVIDSISHFYAHSCANVHRSAYELSHRAMELFENARTAVQQLINAKYREEIVFTSGTTESINLIMQTYGVTNLKHNDEIIVSALEHHSDLVPWQMLCEQTGAKLRIIPISSDGEILLDEYQMMLNDRTKLVAIAYVSNVLGVINPLEAIIKLAKINGTPVLIDGAQAIAHFPIDVQKLDCDFFVFSAHKMYGPTGFGGLYGKKALLEKMPPYKFGGGMVKTVTFEKTIFADLPYKFEAGTPDVAGAVGLAAAINYLQSYDSQARQQHENQLLAYATDALRSLPYITILGDIPNKANIISFVMNNVHASDIATLLDQEGIAVRSGHHCAMPLLSKLNVTATVRASFAMYNQQPEIDSLIHGLEKIKRIFK